jgi:hypothetical protein
MHDGDDNDDDDGDDDDDDNSLGGSVYTKMSFTAHLY